MTKPKKLTEKQVITKIKALGKITNEQRNSIVCSLVGHSKIVSMCFGYVNCARCKDQIGDTLAGCFDLKEHVLVGHNCKECQSNFKKLTWKDKLYAPANSLEATHD